MAEFYDWDYRQETSTQIPQVAGHEFIPITGKFLTNDPTI